LFTWRRHDDLRRQERTRRRRDGSETKSAVRRKPARKTGRRRAADHGKNFPERAMADRRASARRETDPWIGFLPLVD